MAKKESAPAGVPAPAKVETVIEPYDTKGWFKSCLLGFLTGLAVVVPGISGATIAIIFRLYDKLVYAVSTIFRHFRKNFFFLLPIVSGGIVGAVAGFFGVKYGVEYIPFAVVCLFAGLMAGAFPAVTDEIRNEKRTPLRIVLLVLGFAIPVLSSFLVAYFYQGGDVSDPAGRLDTIPLWFYGAALLIGFVIAITQSVPGLSASAFLMAIGYFRAFVESISLTFWKANPAIFGVYFCLLTGFLVGMFLTAKALSWLMRNKRGNSFFAIVGLSAGSIAAMFYNPEISGLYLKWAGVATGTDSFGNAVSMPIDLGLGLGFLAVGFAASLLLVIYQRKKKATGKGKD